MKEHVNDKHFALTVVVGREISLMASVFSSDYGLLDPINYNHLKSDADGGNTILLKSSGV